jgi:hypothetical protein
VNPATVQECKNIIFIILLRVKNKNKLRYDYYCFQAQILSMRQGPTGTAVMCAAFKGFHFGVSPFFTRREE